MALHKVELPRSARLLFRVVALQKRLLKALTNPALTAAQIDVAWLQGVWPRQDAEWVRKFCLGGKVSVLHPLKALAAAPLPARQTLHIEFCRQNKIPQMLQAGGDFRDLAALPGFTAALTDAVRKFFARCYKLLSHDSGSDWPGYALPAATLSNRSYKTDFCAAGVTQSVCPYCDGDIGTPDLDHYYAKSRFPLLSCNPWNLVPACKSCNDAITAKGDRLALTDGPVRSTAGWLHPFQRPASEQTIIRLHGPPAQPMPQLHSPDPAEQTALDNHTTLIRTLAHRWKGKVTSFLDRFPAGITRLRSRHPGKPDAELFSYCLEDHAAGRGSASNSLIHAAVCQAFLDHRPGYLEELADSNPPALSLL